MSTVLTLPENVTGNTSFNNSAITAVQNTAVTTWSTASASEANSWQDIDWSPELSLFVAISSSGTNRVMTSSNGTTWSTASAAQANSWQSVTWSPELSIFVAVSSDGTNRVMTSSDGTTWSTQSAAEANSWQSVTWSPELGLFVAVASSGTNRVMTSPDGITWSTQSAAEANSWQSVTWSPELGLFAAVSSDGTNRVMTSPDGQTWTTRSTQVGEWQDIAWSPELSVFIAVATGTGARITRSTNGTSWSERTPPEDISYTSVVWSPQLSLFCGVASSGTGRVMTSTDSLSWTSRTGSESNSWQSVTWSPELGLFVAVSSDGTNRIMTSDNDFSSYVQTSTIGTRAVTDVTISGQDISIGQSANNITIGQYASGVTIGSPGVPVSIPGIFMGVSFINDAMSGDLAGGGPQAANSNEPHPLRNIQNFGNIGIRLDNFLSSIFPSGSGDSTNWTAAGYTDMIIPTGQYMFTATMRFRTTGNIFQALYNTDTGEFIGNITNRNFIIASGDNVNQVMSATINGTFQVKDAENSFQVLRRMSGGTASIDTNSYGINLNTSTTFGGDSTYLNLIIYRIF